jgi:hypothetical protein
LTAVRSDIDDLQVDKFDSRIRQLLENPRGAWLLSVSATLVDSVAQNIDHLRAHGIVG